MDYAQMIKEKMKNAGGIILAKDLRLSNIPTIYLTRMTKKGELIRAERGIYIDSRDERRE